MNIIDELKQRFPKAILKDGVEHKHAYIAVDKNSLREVMQYLKNNHTTSFDLLLDICGVDYLGETLRFEVVYHLYALKDKQRLRVTTRVSEQAPELATVTDIWPAADWFEREAYDMFGLRFKNHPNLKRLLMWDEFEGHPLRKDYPLNKRQAIPTPKDLL